MPVVPQQRPIGMSGQQLQTLQFLQQNHNSLTAQQQALLGQLQQQYRTMQQYQAQIRLQQQQQQAAQRGLRPGQPGYPAAYSGQPQTLGQPSGIIKNYGIPQQPVNVRLFESQSSFSESTILNNFILKILNIWKFIVNNFKV